MHKLWYSHYWEPRIMVVRNFLSFEITWVMQGNSNELDILGQMKMSVSPLSFPLTWSGQGMPTPVLSILSFLRWQNSNHHSHIPLWHLVQALVGQHPHQLLLLTWDWAGVRKGSRGAPDRRTPDHYFPLLHFNKWVDISDNWFIKLVTCYYLSYLPYY